MRSSQLPALPTHAYDSTRYVNQPGRRPASLYFSCGSQWAEDAAEPGLFRMKKVRRRLFCSSPPVLLTAACTAHRYLH